MFDRFAMGITRTRMRASRVTRFRTRRAKQHRYSLRSISLKNIVKLRNKLMIALALALSVSTLYWTFADELIAIANGVPIRLVSATGSLEPAPGNPFGLEPLIHIHIAPDGALQLVMRTTFHNSSELSRPYLTQDSDGNGLVHIAIRHQPIFGKKCEFVRQFVVEIEPEHWRKLKTLSVYNHDVHGPAGVRLAIGDAQSLQTMIADSKLKRNLEDISGAVFGC
jgi:hypothetical protein